MGTEAEYLESDKVKEIGAWLETQNFGSDITTKFRGQARGNRSCHSIPRRCSGNCSSAHANFTRYSI